MTTNQEGLHATVRALTSTTRSYNEDWHALFDADGITAGPFNARMLAWINATLGTSYTNLNGAMQAFAVEQGFANWASMNTFEAGYDDADIIALSPKAWFDSSYSSSMWQDTGKTVAAGIGDPVKVWVSRVGSLEASTGTDANRPIRAAGGLTFDGTGDGLATGNTTFADTGLSAYAVVKLNSVGAFPVVFAHGSAVQGPELRGVNNTGKMSFVNGATNAGAGVTGAVTPAGTASNIAGAGIQLISATCSTADLWTIWQGKTQRDQRTAAITPTATPAPIYVGNRNASFYWIGDLADILIFNTEHDTATRQSIENYLSSKWGTP